MAVDFRGVCTFGGCLCLFGCLGLVVPRAAHALNFHLSYKDNAENEAGFRAYRTNVPPNTRTKVGEVAANITLIPITDDTTTMPCYVVVAFNGVGESKDSNQTCAVKPAAPDTTVIIVP